MNCAFLIMTMTLFTARYFTKANNIEDHERVLTVLQDAGIADPIDLIVRNDCTKGVMMKFLQSCPGQYLKRHECFKGQ